MDELIKKIKLGDKKSATMFVKTYYDEIYLYVLKLTLNRDTSLDLTQEIFVRALNKIHTVRKNSQHIKSWLYKIAYHYVMTYFKLSKKDRHFSSNELLDFIPSNTNLEGEILKKEKKQNIIKLVYQLDHIYQNVIILRYYQELSIQEISSILNVNENTVKTRISRALHQLKSYFESGDYDEFR